MADGAWTDVERACAAGKGVAPSPTCQFELDEDLSALGGILHLHVPLRWRPPPLAVFDLVAGSHLTLPFAPIFLSRHGMPRC